MFPHRLRLRLIIYALLADVPALALLVLVPISALGARQNELIAMLSGALMLLVPAFVDAWKVELRRRNKKIPAISDDERE